MSRGTGPPGEPPGKAAARARRSPAERGARDDALQARVLGRVRRLSASEALFRRGHLVVVAVSGGQDSVCMLDALVRLQPTLTLGLHVAHVDHRLRGREGMDDARFVSELAATYGLAFSALSVDVPGYRRRHRLSTQVAGRYARYQALARLAGELGAASIAVGHTRDDTVETLLMNLLRGAGLKGLGGIAPSQELRAGLLGPPYDPGVRAQEQLSFRVVRPILDLERRETRAYCRAIGVEPRDDPSNLLRSYLRNRVRAELVPYLEAYSPSVRAILAQTAAGLRADWQVVEKATLEALEQCAHSRPGRVVIRREPFNRELAGVQRNMIRLAVGRLRGTAEGLGWEAVEAVMRAVAGGAPGKRVRLPGGVELRTGYDSFELRLLATDAATRPRTPSAPKPLALPGRTRLEAIGELETSLVEGADILEQVRDELPAAGPWEERVDADKLGGALRVRARRPGDRMRPLGLEFDKKLQDILVDARVPRDLRDLLPLVESPVGIVWLAGVRLDDRFKIDQSTRRVAVLRFRPRAALAEWRPGL